MEHEKQAMMKSKVKGNFNITKQEGNINAESDVDGNLNYTNQKLSSNTSDDKTSWWTKTRVICAVVTAIIAIWKFVSKWLFK